MKKLDNVLKKYFKNSENFDLEDFIYAYGDPKQALLLFRVFWPNFMVVENNVVLKDVIDAEGGTDTLISLLRQSSKPKSEILSGYRWIEVPYIFKDILPNEDDYEIFAEMLTQTWAGALLVNYPEKRFTVKVFNPSQTGSVIGIGFEEENGV